MSNKMNVVDWIALVLLIVGGLNWGLIGVFGFNLVEAITGIGTLGRAVYSLVGIAALYALYFVYKQVTN